MNKPLIIVESPTKVKTIKKYIGRDYNVSSTVGHIKDLPPKEIGIDIENNFKPTYKTISGKQKVITGLKKAAGDAKDIYLAPDPDREGEAIAFHASQVLKKKGRNFHRVLFHELTKRGILAAIKSPEKINNAKYEAQQARRILDRLVGYMISPLLWRKVRGGLSAGRVQSVAVRIITERERAIQAFDPEEYWTIDGLMQAKEPPDFTAKLAKKDGKKIKIPDKKTCDNILKDLSKSSYIIDKITKKTTKRNPPPPFITSTLQQDAIRKLRFSAKKTMVIAQQLYEGIEIGGQPVGLITYMRTDSIRIAKEAAEEALQLITKKFGPDYAMKAPRIFKNKKKKNIQDAHEAIRPTSVFNTPEKIAGSLSPEQLSLYTLIWKRFVACQMQPALINNISIAIKADSYLFTASGSSIKFPGFMAVYMSIEDEKEKDAKKPHFPPLSEGMSLKCKKLDPKQHFTMPPPRFSEASLVKELEENGIGRPSTYASIISTIQAKNYVERISGYFRPTEMGFIVNDLLVENFPNILNVDFTAGMEDNLDKIESEQVRLVEVLSNFYNPFKQTLENASEKMLSMKAVGINTGLNCPECKKSLHIKIGKNGPFLACSGYPDCKYSRNYIRDEKGKFQVVEPIPDQKTDKICEKCGKPMVLKQGRYGAFLACSGYPDCKNTQSVDNDRKPKPTGVSCPNKGCDGEIMEKKSRRGKIFYGCSKYPDCDFASWYKPVPKPCPKCKAPFVVEKTTKKKGTFLKCINKDCDFEKKLKI
ncbi:DNA topoisomerase 1 [Candidatus Magnetomoraceae bacterium gMMP-1]